MNYLKEIVAFQEWLEINPLPPNAQVLWYQLMKIANKLCWTQEWFQVDNRRLMFYTSINSECSLLRARDKLVEKGIVKYRKGKKGSPNSYHLISFLSADSKSDSKSDSKNEVKTIVINKHKTQTKTNILCPNGFDEFWQAYPRKVSKQQAQRAWEKLNPSDETMGLILHALDRFKQSPQWIQNNGQYIPYPATWLNQKRWEDELIEQAKAMPNDRRATRYVNQSGYRDFSDLVE